MSLLHSLRQTVQRAGLTPDAIVVVGVSGGPDSLCLLHALNQLAPELGVVLHVAHLNHGLRGVEAEGDAAFVAGLARDWGLPCTVGQVDLARHGRSLEEAAREARYHFLGELAERLGSTTVAVGHNADDQAETVLMHFLRGSGLAGLRGMLPHGPLPWPPASGVPPEPPGAGCRLIRPLLASPRAEILAYCTEHGLQPRFDRSNQDLTFFRNRLRHELLPLLERYNPQIRRVLGATAEVAAADFDLLHSHTEEAFAALVQPSPPGALLFDLTGWRAQPLAVQRGLLRAAVQRLRGGLRDLGFVHVENALRVLNDGRAGDRATLPAGLEAVLGAAHAGVGKAGFQLPADGAPQLCLASVRLNDQEAIAAALPGCQVQASILSPAALPAGWQENRDPWQAWLDADAAGADPVLRVRRPGDRFQPLGMKGRQKSLAEFFTSAKVQRPARAAWPLLARADDRILWVCGLRLDERARVRARTAAVLHVRLRLPDLPDERTAL